MKLVAGGAAIYDRIDNSVSSFFYPFRNPALGAISVAITAILLFLAHFVLTDLDNPFEGTWNRKLGVTDFAAGTKPAQS